MTQITVNRQSAIDQLSALGYPALPVAPKQDPFKFPLRDKKGKIIYEKSGDNKKTPKARFTGKNPSYLDSEGTPVILNHGVYQNRLPSALELKTWFSNPENGLGTLGGFKGSIWIDFDVKDFESQIDCDDQFKAWLDKYPQLQDAWIEQTHSGGYRALVRCEVNPGFTNFALEPGGMHRGECLGFGRFTVLAPTLGVSGNHYTLLTQCVEAVTVDSLESIGIYPFSKSKVESKPDISKVKTNSNIMLTLELKDFCSNSAFAVLEGVDISLDRSLSLTVATKEWYGWENWLAAKELPFSSTTRDLALLAGEKLDLDTDRVDRILNTIDYRDCVPASEFLGGDKACWKKVRAINQEIYAIYCPKLIQSEISRDLDLGSNSNVGSNYTKFRTPTEARLLDDLADFDAKEFQQLLDKISAEKDCWTSIKSCFASDIVENIEHYAFRTGIKPEAYALMFLTAVSSGINGKYRVEAFRGTGWKESLNIFHCIVGDPGTNKSSVLDLMFGYHKSKNEEYRETYRQEKKQYDFDVQEWSANKKDKIAVGELEPQKPNLRYASMGQATMPKLIATMESQKNIFETGLILVEDELKTILGSFGKYDSGEDEVSRYLTFFSGGEGSTNNKGDGTVAVNRASLSIAATTQPKTWAKMMSKVSDDNGFHQRWLVSEISRSDVKMLNHFDEVAPPHDFVNLVGNIIEHCDSQESGKLILVAKEATQTKQNIELWFNVDPEERAKLKSYIYRLAGIFAVMRDAVNPLIVASDLEAGLALVTYSNACMKSIGGTGEMTVANELVMTARSLFLRKGELSVSLLKSRHRTVFGTMSKEAVSEIIVSVSQLKDVCCEVAYTKQGTPKLTVSTTKSVAKLEKDLELVKVDEPETKIEPTVKVKPQSVEVPEATPEILQVDKIEEVELECVHTETTESRKSDLVVGQLFELLPEGLPGNIRHILNKESKFELVSDNGSRVRVKAVGTGQVYLVSREFVKEIKTQVN